MFFWNSLAFLMIQQMLAVWSLVPLPFLKPAWTSGSSICELTVHILLKPGLECFEHYFTSVWDECNCAVVWACSFANHSSILALRTPWTVWKGKMIGYWKRSIGAQYATGDQWRNNSRKNEGMEPKQKEYPAVDVTGDRSMVWCCKSNIA